MFFEKMSFWDILRVPKEKIDMRFEVLFGGEYRKIEDREEAIRILMSATNTIQEELLAWIQKNDIYGVLMKLYYIFDEIHSFYLEEKNIRYEMETENIDNPNITDWFISNRNIMRNIIDAGNIWIENSILYQKNPDVKKLDLKSEFVLDYELLINLYFYGVASQSLSLLMLSKDIGEENTFYGLELRPKEDTLIEVLRYHPYIYFNTVITGNQNILEENALTVDANNTDFGKGFFEENNVEFLLFLAALKSFQLDQLHGDDKALTIIGKDRFVELVESYTNPKIDGESFYNKFVLSKEKVKQHLRKNEKIIWVIGTNKNRHELRPFIELEDGNILITYGAIEQAKHLWVSYFSNGGMCYTNPKATDPLKAGMEKRNKELSDILVERIRGILNNYYNSDFDYKEVKYQRIFGQRSINYGDFDIIYYIKKTKEVFLIESKYFSDSLNSSGMVTDYKKIFEEDGYYEHCRRRYDLVLSEPERLKEFLNVKSDLKIHLLFISSKPIELELRDKDNVVTFLSLNIFDKYIKGNLISGEDDSIIDSNIII